MVSDRIKALRERLQRREKQTRAGRRAKSRRIEQGDPEGVDEAAQVKFRKAKESAEMTADEARGLARDAKQLVATEFGVSQSEGESIIKQGSKLLKDADNSGGLASLDLDGDGDTDLLSGLESGDENGGGGNGLTSTDGLDPVVDVGGGLAAGGGTDPLDIDAGSEGGGMDPAEPVMEPFEDGDDFLL